MVTNLLFILSISAQPKLMEVPSINYGSPRALLSFYIKITGEGQLRVQLKTTERQENNNRNTQRTVVERDSFTALYFLAFLFDR